MDQRPRVAICIATYKRPQGLARLLGSLAELRFERLPEPELEVVVVDNDPDGSALAVRPDLEGLPGSPVTFLHEPRPGIPYARNAALRAVLGRAHLVAFVDDDETVTPGWLECLLLGRERFRADVVVGPSLPCMPEGVGAWAADGSFHDRVRPRTGTSMSTAPTGNLLAVREVFTDTDRLFDESMALTGGSDTEFFQRAADAGRRIVWVDEAVAYEHVTAARATRAWVLRRAFRLGAVEAMLLRRREGLLSRPAALRAVKGAGHIAVGLATAALGAVSGQKAVMRGLVRSAKGLGSLTGLLGFTGREYARQPT